MENENIFLFHALLMGIFITFVYDIIRIFRRVLPHGGFLISLEDIGFWVYCAAEVFLLMYHESNGTLRWFAVLGALVGMVTYKKIVSNFFVKYVSLFLQRILHYLGMIGSFCSKPVRAMGRNTAKLAHRAVRQGGKSKKFLKKKLTFFLKVLKMNL